MHKGWFSTKSEEVRIVDNAQVKNMPERSRMSAALADSEAMDSEYELDLLELLYRLLEKARWIMAAAILGAVLAGLITVFAITPMYEATAKLYVMNSDDAAINLSDLQIGTYLAKDYQEVFKNWHVHERVIERLDLPYTYREIKNMLEITNPSDTRVLYITVRSKDPQEAKQIADAYAAVSREFIASTMDTREPNIFEEALLPSAPVSPSLVRNTLLGFAAMAMAACAVVIVQFLMDDRIRTSDDLDKYFHVPTLGLLPKQDGEMPSSQKRRRGGEETA